MKIAIIADAPIQRSGLAHTGKDLAWIFSKNHEVSIIGIVGSKPKHYFDTEITIVRHNEKRNCKLFEIYLEDVYTNYISHLIKHLKPDIIITAIGIWDLKKFRKKIGKTKWIHYGYWDGYPASRKVEKDLLSADFHVAISKWSKFVYLDYFGLDVPYIYENIDLSMFERKNKPEKLDEMFVVGNLNANVFRKRLDITIRAFRLFSFDKENARLLLKCNWNSPFGFKLENYIRAYKLEDKIIKYSFSTSYKEHLKTYNLIDLNLNTSGGEGFGYVAIEGFASGKPYLAPSYTTAEEFIGKNERGQLIDVDNFVITERCGRSYECVVSVADLVKQLNFYYYNPSKLVNQKKKCIEFAKQFDIKKSEEKWERVIKEVI